MNYKSKITLMALTGLQTDILKGLMHLILQMFCKLAN